jgi:hypothetical protein
MAKQKADTKSLPKQPVLKKAQTESNPLTTIFRA